MFKKYENRRLYNTLTSQYINQEQVAQLLRDGYDVRVTDASSGEDITRIILAQIVLDDVKTPDSVFPLDILRGRMILASGKATQEGALRYLKAMMETLSNALSGIAASTELPLQRPTCLATKSGQEGRVHEFPSVKLENTHPHGIEKPIRKSQK